MTAPAAPTDRQRRPVSRAPVYVLIVFFAISLTLVVLVVQGLPKPIVVVDRAGTPESPRAVNVIMRDYHFDPEPLVLIPGETVRITVFDAGMEPHDMVLGDATVHAAWSAADAAATPPLPFTTAPPASVPPGTGGVRVFLGSGASETVDYLVPQSGELQLICHLPGHAERGMVGRVELRAAPSNAAPSAPPSG